MVPELAHFSTFHALGSFFDARDIVLNLVRSRASSFKIHANKESTTSNCLEESLKDCFYVDDRDGRETTPYYGVVEADQILIKSIEFLNYTKLDFKSTLTKLSLLDPNAQSEMMKIIKDPSKWPSRLERYASDLGRLNINHVYRCYFVAKDRPLKIQQSWSSKSKSIKKITKKEAINRILSLENPLPDHLKIQYESLASLPDSASLAVVHSETPHIKTNLFFRDRKEPVTVKSRLPMIVPNGTSRIFMDFISEDAPQESKDHQRRKDVLIHESPVASSIHVYRYRDFHDQR